MSSKISKELKELVLYKLDMEVPANFKMSIGKEGTFTRDQLKSEVKSGSEVGKIYVEMQLNFMRSLMNGEISAALAKC